MLESMTGFGRGEYTTEHYRAFVELRSVNSRYCEISLKTPSQLHTYEQPLKETVQKHLKRGKVSLTIALEHLYNKEEPVQIQEEMLRTRIKTLEKVREIAGIEDPLRLEHLLVFEDLFELSESEPSLLQEQYKCVEKATMQAIEELLEMRRSEGQKMQEDLEQRLDTLAAYCKEIRDGEQERIHEARRRMTERLDQILEENRVSEDRIEQEIAILADRLDISEELVRMDSHISYFNECLLSSDLQGKKLNFILQEMHREVNTIGSKANSSTISRTVVSMKEIIENIREQIQNIA
ncbi:MAG: YicC/YloC family endoribonuclease [Cyclonatronaceae bacterium]